jgi:hypothetical protein
MRKISQNNLAYTRKNMACPFITPTQVFPIPDEIKKSKMARVGNDQKGFIVNNGSGEILASGVAVVYEWEEVDKERFVKLYLAGLKQAAGLSKAGLLVFEMVYKQVQENPEKDTVLLSADQSNLAQATYFRGLRELLDKEFLFRSPYDGTFFVNIRFMFNGDRLAFIKGYRLKGSSQQQELPLLEAIEGKREE